MVARRKGSPVDPSQAVRGRRAQVGRGEAGHPQDVAAGLVGDGEVGIPEAAVVAAASTLHFRPQLDHEGVGLGGAAAQGVEALQTEPVVSCIFRSGYPTAGIHGHGSGLQRGGGYYGFAAGVYLIYKC